MSSLHVLFVGWQDPGTTSLMRFQAFQRLGHDVTGINLSASVSPINHFINRVSGKLFRMGFGCFSPRDTGGKNAAIVRAFREGSFDVLWIEKGVIIDAASLRERDACSRSAESSVIRRMICMRSTINRGSFCGHCPFMTGISRPSRTASANFKGWGRGECSSWRTPTTAFCIGPLFCRLPNAES